VAERSLVDAAARHRLVAEAVADCRTGWMMEAIVLSRLFHAMRGIEVARRCARRFRV
jgi:hypothetical protein